MNKNIKLAVAGAVLALSASAANAGIVIPAGDWTLDIGGIVNTYATWTRSSGDTGLIGKGAAMTTSKDALAGNTNAKTQSNMTTGLLPNYLTVSGSTRQNDLDVTFLISIQPGSSGIKAGVQGNSLGYPQQENRQAYLTFGDKSWGSIKVGKDLGIFASDAILNDMTLLGVGSAAGGLAGNTTTLGRIGTGFVYADWKSQIAYTTPNFNGFQATAGLTQAWNSQAIDGDDQVSTGRAGAGFAYEGKASYSFAANDVTGKVWVSGLAQKFQKVAGTNYDDRTAYAGDIGANVNFAGFGLTGYYYSGQGIGQTVQFLGAFDPSGRMRDANGGYVQATYVLPTKTKVGLSWGQSTLERNLGDTGTTTGIGNKDMEDSMWAAGLYHPLTKHLNLVAEYTDTESKQALGTGHGRTGSLGAIMFF
jgi:predicted porin